MSHPEDASESDDLEPLKIKAKGGFGAAALQAALALGVIAFATHIFVDQLNGLALRLHLAPYWIALWLSPMATELPETLNAIIWVRQGKPALALANISGAMMIQACVPAALGIGFTPWLFDRTLILSGLITVAAVLYLWIIFTRAKADARWVGLVGLFYGVFAWLALT